MNISESLRLECALGATIIRGDGSHRNCGIIAADRFTANVAKRTFLASLKKILPIAGGIIIGGIVYYFGERSIAAMAPMAGLVTTAGADLLAKDFCSGAGTHIAAFNYHGVGTGTTAAAIGNTGLETPASVSRVAGTQTSGTTKVYQSVATVTGFGGATAVTEWGLFSAAGSGSPPTGGTLWDRRVFSVINVGTSDSIQFTYQLTVPDGGS